MRSAEDMLVLQRVAADEVADDDPALAVLVVLEADDDHAVAF